MGGGNSLCEWCWRGDSVGRVEEEGRGGGGKVMIE